MMDEYLSILDRSYRQRIADFRCGRADPVLQEVWDLALKEVCAKLHYAENDFHQQPGDYAQIAKWIERRLYTNSTRPYQAR